MAEPVPIPLPPAAEVEVADVQAANAVPKDRPPEEDVADFAVLIFLPTLGDQVRVLVEGIQDIRVEHRLAGELFAKLVALEVLPALLALGQVQDDLEVIDVETVVALLDDRTADADMGLDFEVLARQLRTGLEIHRNGGIVDLDPAPVDFVPLHEHKLPGEEALTTLFATAFVAKAPYLLEGQIFKVRHDTLLPALRRMVLAALRGS